MIAREQIDEMARLKAIMDGRPFEPSPMTEARSVVPTPPAVCPAQFGDGVNEMKDIIAKLYGNTSVVNDLMTEANSDPQLRKAMITEETDNGVMIGEWEIVVKSDRGRRFFDVVSQTGVVIAADLTLYEAAYGIANELAEGKPITTQKVRSILLAEDDYAAAVNDAIHFKHNLRKRHILTETKREVIEDRYEASKFRAIKAKALVEKLVGPIDF